MGKEVVIKKAAENFYDFVARLVKQGRSPEDIAKEASVTYNKNIEPRHIQAQIDKFNYNKENPRGRIDKAETDLRAAENAELEQASFAKSKPKSKLDDKPIYDARYDTFTKHNVTGKGGFSTNTTDELKATPLTPDEIDALGTMSPDAALSKLILSKDRSNKIDKELSKVIKNTEKQTGKKIVDGITPQSTRSTKVDKELDKILKESEAAVDARLTGDITPKDTAHIKSTKRVAKDPVKRQEIHDKLLPLGEYTLKGDTPVEAFRTVARQTNVLKQNNLKLPEGPEKAALQARIKAMEDLESTLAKQAVEDSNKLTSEVFRGLTPESQRYLSQMRVTGSDIKSKNDILNYAPNLMTSQGIEQLTRDAQAGNKVASGLLAQLSRNKGKIATLGVLGAGALALIPGDEEPSDIPDREMAEGEDVDITTTTTVTDVEDMEEQDIPEEVKVTFPTFNFTPDQYEEELTTALQKAKRPDITEARELFLNAIEGYQKKADNLQEFMIQATKDKKATAKEIREYNKWSEVADKMVDAVRLIASGLVGINTGAFPEMIPIKETNWAAKLQQELDSLDSSYNDLQKDLLDKYGTTIKSIEKTTEEAKDLEDKADKALEREQDILIKDFESKRKAFADKEQQRFEADKLKFQEESRTARDRERAASQEKIAKVNADARLARDMQRQTVSESKSADKQIAKIPTVEGVLGSIAGGRRDPKVRVEAIKSLGSLMYTKDEIDNIRDYKHPETGESIKPDELAALLQKRRNGIIQFYKGNTSQEQDTSSSRSIISSEDDL